MHLGIVVVCALLLMRATAIAEAATADYAVQASRTRVGSRSQVATTPSIEAMLWHIKAVFGWLLAVVALVAMSFPNPANADSGVAGAQYSCQTRTQSFDLLPYEPVGTHSHDSVKHKAAPIKPGYVAIPDGMSNLKCRLGSRTAQVQIGVTAPQNHGMCMGDGEVVVTSVIVDGVELLNGDLLLDWACTGSKDDLVELALREVKAGVNLKKCAVSMADGKTRCVVEHFNVTAIAAKNHGIDHHLADAATQALESATHLPADADLARVFPSTTGSPALPLCAHWADWELDGETVTQPDDTWYAHIAGVDGERVYVHPTEPQLCRSTADDGCNPTAYVVPGDRVDVGFICGSWSYVRVGSRVRTKRDIDGWVETVRLYDVHMGKGLQRARIGYAPQQSPGMQDPLVLAAVAGDTVQRQRLVAAGESSDGLDKTGAPLNAAIDAGNLDSVKTPLNLQSNPGLRRPDGKCIDLNSAIQQPELFATLVAAGADPKCESGYGMGTALIWASFDDRIDDWHHVQYYSHFGPVYLRDPTAEVVQLLKAGANPNAVNNDGQTALFSAADNNNIDIAKILLDAGANASFNTDATPTQNSLGVQEGSTPLMHALYSYHQTHDPAMIELLLDHGANPNDKNKLEYDEDCDETTEGACTFAGQTILTRAAEDGDYTVVRVLLEHGADPTIGIGNCVSLHTDGD
jgi:ankyrin repeat protein